MTVDPRITLIREWRRTSDPDDTVALRALVLAVADIVDPPPSPDSPDVPVWKAPTGAHDAYRPGAVIRYAGGVYRCIAGHTSMVGWEPDAVPALWGRV